MDQKMVLSAIGMGVGVGVGIGLASGQTVRKWRGNTSSSLDPITADTMEKEMMRMVIDGKDSQVTFDQFPYYLRFFPMTLGYVVSCCAKPTYFSSGIHLM